MRGTRSGTDVAPLEKVEFLARSPNRVDLLDILAERGPVSRDVLKDELAVSRSTLQRNLRQLEDREWIRRVDDEYDITALGKRVLLDLRNLVRTMRLDTKLAPIVKWLPPDAFDFDLRLLADATVTLSTPSDPYAPVTRHIQALESSESYRGLLPSVDSRAIELGKRRMTRGETEKAEIVIERAVAETLRATPSYERQFEEIVETGLMDVYVYEGHLPFYLGLIDDTVQIGAEDASGMQRALLEVDHPEVIAWAEKTFETYKQQATKITKERRIDLSAYVPMYGEFTWISPTGNPSSLRTLTDLPARCANLARSPFRIVDVGCGTGVLTAAVAEQYDRTTVVGVNQAEPAARRTHDRTRSVHNVDVVHGTPESLRSETVDFLYAINMVHDTANPKATMPQLYEVLREGGFAAVTVPTSGAEELFVAPARSREDATVTETDTQIRIETDQFTVTTERGDDTVQINLVVDLTEVDIPVDTLSANQFTFDRTPFRELCREAVFTLREEGELACDPSGIPHMMDTVGFAEEAEQWREVIDSYKRNPERVRDRLPTVAFYLLKR